MRLDQHGVGRVETVALCNEPIDNADRRIMIAIRIVEYRKVRRRIDEHSTFDIGPGNEIIYAFGRYARARISCFRSEASLFGTPLRPIPISL